MIGLAYPKVSFEEEQPRNYGLQPLMNQYY